jgi:hypothetical protein
MYEGSEQVGQSGMRVDVTMWVSLKTKEGARLE